MRIFVDAKRLRTRVSDTLRSRARQEAVETGAYFPCWLCCACANFLRVVPDTSYWLAVEVHVGNHVGLWTTYFAPVFCRFSPIVTMPILVLASMWYAFSSSTYFQKQRIMTRRVRQSRRFEQVRL